MASILSHALIISTAFLGGFTAHGIIASPSKYNMKAAKIIDGDSLEIDNIWQTQIRLHGIDTPEKGKAFYAEAADKLKTLCLKKDITLKNKSDGGFGRVAANVNCGGVFVNPEMIKAGLAIVSIRHAKDISLYELQTLARQNCRGIWSKDITKIYHVKKLQGQSYAGEKVQFTNNTNCILKIASY